VNDKRKARRQPGLTEKDEEGSLARDRAVERPLPRRGAPCRAERTIDGFFSASAGAAIDRALSDLEEAERK
jgi:hypothetical protein